jgi:hypothetical protein
VFTLKVGRKTNIEQTRVATATTLSKPKGLQASKFADAPEEPKSPAAGEQDSSSKALASVRFLLAAPSAARL